MNVSFQPLLINKLMPRGLSDLFQFKLPLNERLFEQNDTRPIESRTFTLLCNFSYFREL